MTLPPVATQPLSPAFIRRAFVLLLLVVFGYFALRVFGPFLSYMFLGGLFVYLLYPIHSRLTARIKRERISAGIVLLFFTVSMLAPLVWVGIEVASTATSALGEADPEDVIATVERILDGILRAGGFEDSRDSMTHRLLNATLPAFQERMRAAAPSLVAAAGQVTIGLLVMAFTIYYGLIDGPRFVQSVKTALPLPRDQADNLVDEVRRTVDAVFLGHIIVAVIQGVIGGIGFAIFGVPNAVFWGFVMILLALVPLIGPPVIWIPAVLFLLFEGRLWPAVGLLAWSALLVSTLDNILRPRIVGSRADIHPLLVLVGVIGGIAAFGFVGFVTGPLVIAMLVAVVKFWREEYLEPETGDAAS